MSITEKYVMAAKLTSMEWIILNIVCSIHSVTFKIKLNEKKTCIEIQKLLFRHSSICPYEVF